MKLLPILVIVRAYDSLTFDKVFWKLRQLIKSEPDRELNSIHDLSWPMWYYYVLIQWQTAIYLTKYITQ